jgi:hypothetical protein
LKKFVTNCPAPLLVREAPLFGEGDSHYIPNYQSRIPEMNMKNTNTKTALSLGLAGLALSAFTANAATVLIDFGRSDNFASGYNGVAMTTENTNNATSGLISLFEGASDTGWDIVVTETGPVTTGGANGGNAGAGADQATFPVALSSFSTTALQDSIYGTWMLVRPVVMPN